MQLLSSNQIGRVRTERRELEVDVAKQIGQYLIARQRHHIRDLILSILTRILSLPLCEPTRERAREMERRLDQFLKGQTSFAMWAQCHTHPGFNGLEVVRGFVCSDLMDDYIWLCVCSDVIRLFGELAEQNLVMPGPDIHWPIMRDKQKLRPEPVYATPPRDREGNLNAEWDGWGHRDRGKRSKAEAQRAKVGAPFLDIPRDRVELRGVERFKFEDHSVIQTLDWTYGLQIEGGDVSGTTTDSIAALRYAAGGEPNPVAQLIAIATMVPQGHHTIVECAWPLTRHGYMKYAIGFYGTLAPDHGCPGLRSELEAFDGDRRNKHVLVCKAVQKNKQPPVATELALHFERPELELYKQLAGVRTAYGFCAGGPPRLESVANFIQTHAKGMVGRQIVDRVFSQYQLSRPRLGIK